MKFGDVYELKCFVCGGTEFVRRLDLAVRRDPTRVSGARAAGARGFSVAYDCVPCDAARAFVYRADPTTLLVREAARGPDTLIKIPTDISKEICATMKRALLRTSTAAHIFFLRHGLRAGQFALAANVTIKTAKYFLELAEKRVLQEDAKIDGVEAVDLQKRRRKEAMDFYRSIVQDQAMWERDHKTVMQARRELSALEGIAGDTGQVNVNVNNNTQQVTVYQLKVPDNHRLRDGQPKMVQHVEMPAPPPTPVEAEPCRIPPEVK